MAAPHAIAGLDGATAVIIASAAVAVWAAGMIAGGTAGILAAAFLAFAPAFLYQSIQPMSDVPVTAAWLLSFVLLARDRRSVGAGVACAIAVLIRPNLAPLAIVPFALSTNKRWFAVPVAVAAVFLAVLHDLWYGSPFRSGYGTAEELFSLTNIVPNAGRYASWLVATSPILYFAPIGFARVKRDAHARALFAFSLLVIGAYLIYAVFEQWSYLRFVLPAMAVFAVFTGIAFTAWIKRWPVALRSPLFLALMLGAAAHGLFVAGFLDTFKLRDQVRRVEQVAAAIDHSTPANAVLIAGEQSGSMRYYTGRSILRWEAATPETLPTAIEIILKAERPIYIVLDAWEREPFRRKFPDIGPAELDWPPILEAGSTHRTFVWNLADRRRFQIGQTISTVRLP